MTDYIHAIIYKLIDNEGNFYFGSTILNIRQRYYLHKYHSKHFKAKVYQIFTYDKFCNGEIRIEIIERVVVRDKRQLKEFEDLYIKCEMDNMKCLNDNRAFRTEDEKKEQLKQYREEHKDYYKKYRDDHKDYFKKYREDHKDYFKQYYINHKDHNRPILYQ